MVREISKSASGFLSYFTRHKTAANLLLLLLLGAGILTIPNMRAQFFPDVVVEGVSVNVRWDGAGAEDVDEAIVQVLEPTLLAVDGVTDANSTSREGSASIRIEFEPDWDMSKAMGDVESAVDQVGTLPEDAEDPTVVQASWRDRVTDVVISGPLGVEQLGLYADELVLRLFAEGVTRTTVQGLAAPEVMISVTTANLIAYDITMRQIATAISEEVNADPAGDVSGGNSRVRTGVEKRSADDISGIILRSNPDGSTLRVGDVAQVSVEGVDRIRAYYVGNDPAIALRVDRSNKGDAIAIQHTVERVAAELERTLPEGANIELIRTRAEYITGRLNLLLENGIMGLGLVVLLLFMFLNARTAFWVAAGIPTAMAAAIAIMYVAGLTFNMISLFALIITLGIVVDDAIVVGEHADFQARRGLGPYEAAEKAAQRMALPVIAATLTTIIAFFGLVAVGGRFGSLIADIPFTVVAVLAASLVECFLILPNHMAHSLKASQKERWYDLPSRVVNKGFEKVREGLFRPFMGWVVRARYVVMAGVIALLASQVVLFITGEVNFRFFNAPEQSSVSGNFAMVSSATREDTVMMMNEMQRAVEATGKEYEKKYGTNPIVYVLAEVGGNSGRGLSGTENKTPDQLGAISIELIDRDLRSYSSFAFVADLQDEVRKLPLTETVSFRGWRSGPGGDALDVQFYGATAETLKAAAEDLKTATARFPIVSGVEDDLAYDKEELILELTPKGQALGFTIDSLGRVLRDRLNGIEAATFPLGPRSASIRVELAAGELTADFLEHLQLRSANGGYVPLADIVSVQRRDGFSTVRRENGIRLVSVTGDIAEDDPEAAQGVIDALEQEILPEIASKHQVEWRLGGLAEQEDAFLNDARTGLILVLAGIYLVLVWIFSSWTRPIVVMAIIPFGLIGTIYGHASWEVPLSMFTVVGMLGMTGIIINDSIVLITTIDEYAKDRGIVPSIIDGATDRLRPVLLTTLTTVLGLTPLLYENSSQAEFLKPTVITLVYGLGFGMVLVLLVVPSLIAMQNDFTRLRNAYQTSLRVRHTATRLAFIGMSLVILGWFGVTLGSVIVLGQLPQMVSGFAPNAFTAGPSGALALFVMGALMVAFVGFVISHVASLMAWFSRKRTV